MSHFYEALHPDDVPDWHQGEWIPDDDVSDINEVEEDNECR